MAFAYGIGHGVGFGFGLGFLNLIGTLLFFGLIVFAIRTLVWGGRHRWRGRSGGPGGPGSSWRGGPGPWRDWSERMHGGSGDATEASAGPAPDDEAMTVARQRLAEGAIDPEAFATIREGLERSRPSPRNHADDAALHTLRMRFAQGELDRETFDAVRAALT